MYLDDILIYTEAAVNHEECVIQVLQALQEHGLFTKLEKCEFSQDSVEYLGFIISPQGLSMDPTQVQSITEWPCPTSVKEIQSFLGFCNFY